MLSSLSEYVPIVTEESMIGADKGMCAIKVVNQLSNMNKFEFNPDILDAGDQVDCEKFNDTYGDCFISGSSSNGFNLDSEFTYHRLRRGWRFHWSCVDESSRHREKD